MHVRVKTAKGRKLSSTLWLERQLNDPYVAAAGRDGYRSRAAYKIIELDERFHFLKPGMKVVDLGAAPGGWTQYIVNTVARPGSGGKVVALDIIEMEPIAGAHILTLDFEDDTAPGRVKELLGGPADAVLSDMAAPTTGHPKTDHMRIMGLVELAYQFAAEVLAPGGCFVAKVFQGGTERQLLADINRRFDKTRHAKPPASRAGSSEMFIVAQGFKGEEQEPDLGDVNTPYR